MPWNAVVLLFSLPDAAFQSTVGEGVALVEVKVAFIVEKTATSFR